MKETKTFHLGDVITITTGRLVSERHIDGVYEILNWMSGESLFTHQLPRVGREAEPILSALYPHLSKAALSSDLEDLDRLLAAAGRDKEKSAEAVKVWLSGLVSRLGFEFEVPKLDADQHERIDPLSELSEKVHPDRIIGIRT